MKNLREVSERIFDASGSEAESIGKENVLNAIESVLKELMEEAWLQGKNDGIKEVKEEIRSGAFALGKEASLRQAVLIVERECGNGCTEDHRKYIVAKIRALMGGG